MTAKIWGEVWSRPGAPSFGRRIADLPVASASYTRRANGTGSGTAEIPSTFGRFDDLLRPDPAAPALAVSSLVRIFQEGVAVPIGEWLPSEMTGTDTKDDQTRTVKGADIFSLLGYARLEAWDWTGADDEESKWPDWIWGGRNLLGDVEVDYRPAIHRIYIPTGVTGTFTIGLSYNGGAIQNTTALAVSATAATIRTALIALASVVDIEVSGTGTATDPWRIVSIDPQGNYVFSVNSGGLTGGIAVQDRETIGELLPAGYTTSFNPVNNISHGSVTAFRAEPLAAYTPVPACATTGWGVYFDGGAGDFPGFQKIVEAKPGGRYYATATARPIGASGSYRLVVRDLFENPIAAYPTFQTGVTLAADTWTTVTIPVVAPVDGQDRVILRFASVDGTNPPPTLVTCLELREGMPPTTWGDIWTQIYLDATFDHAGAGRVVWEQGATGTPYLTLDFDAAVDSAGNAWTHPEVSITLKREQSYLRVAGECFKQGYEGRIVPDDVALGTWKFQLFNQAEAGTILTLPTDPVVMGGRDVVKRDDRRFLPTFTDWAVEAAGQAISRRRSTDAISALGRIEGYMPEQDLGSLIEAGAAADTALLTGLLSSQSLAYTVTGVDGSYPLADYDVFDTVMIDDSPDVAKTARRIQQIQLTWSSTTAEYSLQLGAESYVGVGAIYEGVARLLSEYQAIRLTPRETTDALNYAGGGGGAMTVSVAASDATDLSKGKADFICTGINDQVTLRQAAAATGGNGSTLWLSEGQFNCKIDQPDTLEFYGIMRGMGVGATEINVSGGASADTFLKVVSDSLLADLTIDGTTAATLVELENQSALMSNCRITQNGLGNAVEISGGRMEWCIVDADRIAVKLAFGFDAVIRNSYVESSVSIGIDAVGFGGPLDIQGCYVSGETAAIKTSSPETFIKANHIISFAGPAIDISGSASRTQVDGNLIAANVGAAIVASLAVDLAIRDNTVWGSDGAAIKLTGCTRPRVKGNDLFDVNRTPLDVAAIVVDGTGGVLLSRGGSIVDNTIDATIATGIRVLGGYSHMRVSGNTVTRHREHGVWITDLSESQISDNLVAWLDNLSGDNTWDGLLVDGNSDRNTVEDNTVVAEIPAGGPGTRWGINVAAATCNDNFVVGNFCYLVANFVSGPYNDAGTGTMNTYAGAFGDNRQV